MLVFDQFGTRIELGPEIRSGGEGAILPILSNSSLVAKLYHKPPSTEKQQKLEHLLRVGNSDLQKIAAWPLRLLFKDTNKLIGFVMPKIEGKPIHKLYGPKDRYQEFPTADWAYLTQVAANAAAALDTLHVSRIVMGDINESNFLVTASGLVRLIDCDSMQVEYGKSRFLCEVGVPLWTPPELQNKDFGSIVRTPNHDRFGLAVLIFLLLFLGRHPFAGIHISNIDSIEEAIGKFLFAYSIKNRSQGVKQPPHSLPLTALTPELIALFERAFCRGSERDGSRPSASEWHSELTKLLKSLQKCSVEKSHLFSRLTGKCSWCDLIDQGAPNFFVFIDSGNGELSLQTVNGVLRDIQATRCPEIRLNPRFTGSVQPRSISIQIPAMPAKPTKPTRNPDLSASMGLGAFLVIVGLFVVLKVQLLFGTLMSLGGISILVFTRRKEFDFFTELEGYRKLFQIFTEEVRLRDLTIQRFLLEKEKRRKTLNDVNMKIQDLQKRTEHSMREWETEFNTLKERATIKGNSAMYLETERKADLRKLETKKRELLMSHFLDQHYLRAAKISGIGSQKLANLIASGVETALDINNSIVVPGIGPALKATLLAWRRDIERKFVFDPRSAIPISEVQSLNSDYRRRLASLESELRRNLIELKNTAKAASELQAETQENLLSLASVRAQSEADLAVCDQSFSE